MEMIVQSIPVPTTQTTIALAVAGLTGYLIACRRMRYVRSQAYSARFAGQTREELYQNITLTEAEEVIHAIARYEFPRIYNTSLQFALFRTYAIPSISALLKKTKQIAERQNGGRRYADTVVLIAEFTAWPLNSERASLALARMNYLHSLHPIQARDSLYTLLLFATQPIEFIDRMEWRPPTELEKVASWKFWFEVGVRMKIPAQTIPATFEDMMLAYRSFEEAHMVPNATNSYVGQNTMELLLYWLPTRPLKWVGRQAVFSLLDERLRTAMLFPSPPAWVPPLVHGLVEVRRWVLRHLCLPRPDGSPVLYLNDQRDPHTGRYFMRRADNEPWYLKKTWRTTWGFWGWVERLGGWPTPGTPGFGEKGYEIESVGPVALEKSGTDAVRREAQIIMGLGPNHGRGCPLG